ncbi:TetR/AcrR family transcriptional regulator [Agromyces bauzanensis]
MAVQESPGAPAAAPASERGGRRQRKAELTRRRLLDAARDQLAEDGPESVTIQAITTRADIGQGTFYNYFKSRDEMIDEVIFDVVEGMGQRLDALTAGMDDAALIYSFSLRHLMRTAVTDPVWGWFIVRVGIAQEGLLRSLGPRASRDLQIGVDSGRFTISSVPIASDMTFGSLLAVMRDYLQGDRSVDPSDVYAENLLRMVGIPADEAHRISRLPLPPLPVLGARDGG